MIYSLIYDCLLILAVLALNGCIGKYEYMTHLSEEDLAWIAPYNIGDIVYFYSDRNHIDTLRCTEKTIDNRQWPFFIHFIDDYRDYYWAMASYSFYISGESDAIKGWFSIDKSAHDGQLDYSTSLDRILNTGWSTSFNFKTKQVEHIGPPPTTVSDYTINHRVYPNCIVVDSLNSKNWSIDSIITSYVFNRDIGLLCYEKTNGELFVSSRVLKTR